MNDVGDSIRTPVLDELDAVSKQHPYIGELMPAEAVGRVVRVGGSPFNAEKVRLRLQLRLLNQECSLPTKLP